MLFQSLDYFGLLKRHCSWPDVLFLGTLDVLLGDKGYDQNNRVFAHGHEVLPCYYIRRGYAVSKKRIG